VAPDHDLREAVEGRSFPGDEHADDERACHRPTIGDHLLRVAGPLRA
jgi:hypothetical protein